MMCFKQLFLAISVSVLTKSGNAEVSIDKNLPIAQNLTVFQRGLCVKNPTKDDILTNHNSYYSYTNDTRIMTKLLGFLEISNDDSFGEASRFAHKFSMLSPYELQIRKIGPQRYDISDIGWIKLTKKWAQNLAKSERNDVKILPLITFPDWKTTDILLLISSYKEIMTLSTELLKVCEKNHLDGLILDIWSGFYGKMPVSSILFLISEISARLRFGVKHALVVIPPMYANPEIINKKTFESMADFANYVILEMYDYSSSWTPGPNSPVSPIEDFVKYLTPDPLLRRSTIIIGVNFFGTAFTRSGTTKVMNNEYLQLLEAYDSDELEFDDVALEHHFQIRTKNEDVLVYYPTLYSMHSRVRLANKLGVGLAVVKLGEGLEYLYDVL